MKHPAFQLTVLLLLLALASLPAHAIAPAYTVTDLGDLGGNRSYAWAVNNSGQVAGYSYIAGGSNYHAFLWRLGCGMTDLGTFGGATSRANGTNDSGQVVGSATNSTGQSHAFVWRAGVGMTDLGTLGGTHSAAWGINSLGQVVGGAYNSAGGQRGFLWTPGVGMVDLGVSGRGYAVNDSAQVVGYDEGSLHQSFFWESATGLTWIDGLWGFAVSARSVNNSGVVVGSADTELGDEGFGSKTPHAFIWDRAHGMQDLGTLSSGQSGAYGINNLGQVVGGTTGAGAFIWEACLGMVDLNTRLVSSPGWQLTTATAISDTGYITALGTDPFGKSHSYLLTPVPEPGGLLLMASGVISIAICRRRRR